jgi:SAM-dependent methyltransferase
MSSHPLRIGTIITGILNAIVPGFDDWSTFAQSADADELREHILTGFKSGKPFTPYVPTLVLPAPLESVLDFGCGLGRNFPYLKTIATRVTGFDLPAMIERCRTLATERVDQLVDDWRQVATHRFDLVFTALVLQHIETDACRAYLADLARIAPAMYVLTRVDNDFGASVLALIAETGAFEAGPCVEVVHDAGTHQLRLLGRRTFEDARRSATSGHYEVLLRSKVVDTFDRAAGYCAGSGCSASA